MDLLDVASDTEKEVHGTWVNYDAKTKFKIGSMGSDLYAKRIKEIREPIAKALPRGVDMEEAVGDAIFVQALVECVLLDWQGLMLNGIELAYSKETATAALRNPQLRQFRGWVIQESMRFANFAAEKFEGLLGNSQSSSASTVQ